MRRGDPAMTPAPMAEARPRAGGGQEAGSTEAGGTAEPEDAGEVDDSGGSASGGSDGSDDGGSSGAAEEPGAGETAGGATGGADGSAGAETPEIAPDPVAEAPDPDRPSAESPGPVAGADDGGEADPGAVAGRPEADAGAEPEPGVAEPDDAAAGNTATGDATAGGAGSDDVGGLTAAPTVETGGTTDGVEATRPDTDGSTELANAPPPESAAANADPEEAVASAEVETRTLTEEDTRSSDEAFLREDEDDELTWFQRALLLGLGAATVGAVLSDGSRVVDNTGDRVVVERDGVLQILKDDDVLLRQPGATISQRRYDDGSTLSVVERDGGARVTTVRAADGRVLRRTRTLADGTEVVLFDDTRPAAPVETADLDRLRGFRAPDAEGLDDLRLALAQVETPEIDRTFTLQQVRQILAVRELMPQVDVAAIEFDSGSALILPSEAEALRDIGLVIAQLVEEDPSEVFLVEGHTDAVGSAPSNLTLSDRRAESVALALTEYFDVPPENLIAQGYGESNLKVATEDALRENRRASVRRITPLLQGAGLE